MLGSTGGGGSALGPGAPGSRHPSSTLDGMAAKARKLLLELASGQEHCARC